MADQEGDWTFSRGAQPIFWSLAFLFICLAIVSFPQYTNRWTSISVLVVTAYAAFEASNNLSPDDMFNEIFTLQILIGTSHILSMICQNSGLKDVSNQLDVKHARPTWNPWYRGYKLVSNTRGVGTPWESPYLWPGIKYTWLAPKPSKGPVELPEPKPITRHNLASKGKWTGVTIRLGYLLVNFLLLVYYYEYVTLEYLLDIKESQVLPEQEGIIRRLLLPYVSTRRPTTPVTHREFQVRAFQAFDNIASDTLVLTLYHDLCAIVCIGLGLDESWEWPPFFGLISEAYTVRRFWSRYWHRSVYRSFSNHAALIIRALGVRQGTSFSRTLSAFLVFGISSVMHAIVVWKYGSPCAWGRSMFYWILQPVAFVIESVVQLYWGKLRRRVEEKLNLRALDMFERTVGYIWVCAWLVWVTTKRRTPLMNCGT